MFRVFMNVDGYCSNKTVFFIDFNKALDYAKEHCHIWDHDGQLKFESMKDANINTDNKTYFQMFGIAHEDRDLMDSEYGHVEITEENFTPKDKIFFELMSDNGYMATVIYGDKHVTYSQGYFQTREEAEEAGNKYKDYYKSWKDGSSGLDFTGAFLFVAQREIIL